MKLVTAAEHVGDGVVYQAYPGATREDGDIVRVNDTYVFVRFVGRRQPVACYPDSLELVTGEHR